jgi:hypothetical protein
MILLFNVRTLLQLVRKIKTRTYQHFFRVFEAIGTDAESNNVDEVYRNLEPLNFSKGILAKVAITLPEALSTLRNRP